LNKYIVEIITSQIDTSTRIGIPNRQTFDINYMNSQALLLVPFQSFLEQHHLKL